MAPAKYFFSTGSGNIITIEADSNMSCQELMEMAKVDHPSEKVIDVYSEHVYPLPYQKKNTGTRDKKGGLGR
jgi:hypothetical protein